MAEPTLDDVASAPLPPGPLADTWRVYATAWHDGARAKALTTLNDFTDDLAAGPPEITDRFAEWLCRLLFDRSRYWRGQWGGATYQGGARFDRPAAPALTVHPLSARIVAPYLLAAFPDGAAHQLRWLYQFAVGQAYRLPPADRARLDSVLTERFGPEAPRFELLRHAAADPIARQMLRDAEAPDR